MISKEVKMKINRWINDVVRIQIARPNKSEYLRLDCAERMYNYEDKFFSEFMSTLTQEDFITYPSYKEYNDLKQKIADYIGVEANNVTLGTGSDSCIKDLIQVTCSEDSEIVSSTPCFPMYFVYGDTFGANFVKVPYGSDGTLDLEGFRQAVNEKTRLVILTNPNSPYGDYKTPGEIESLCKFLEERGIIFLIDEAYVDFSQGSCVEFIKKYKNVVVSRTFSKAWGAAGIRTGYLVASAPLIELVSKVQLTYPITGVSVKFASFLLDNYEYIENYARQTAQDRDELCSLLRNSGYDVVPAETNTIHFHESNGDNQKTISILESHGVAFKCGGKLTGTMVRVPMDDRGTWIRLSVGPGIQDAPFIKEILSQSDSYQEPIQTSSGPGL